MIKQAVKSAFTRLGYQVFSSSVPLVRRARYESLIDAYAELLHASYLTALPEMTPKRRALMADLVGTPVPQAMLLVDSLHQVLDGEGDVCEFGVAQGATSALLANEILDARMKLWLFDSFQGLPKPTEKDGLKDDICGLGDIRKYAGTMKCGVDMVTSRLAQVGFPVERTEIVPGFIEQTLSGSRVPQKVIFAFVDLDLYQPISTALKFLDKVIVERGIIVIHDYDYFSTGAKAAVDEFLSSHAARYRVICYEANLTKGIKIIQRLGDTPVR